MDSAEFLDLLGNGNRRRILRLLARKPCYVTEISEQLGVSPKAVIDHLEKLEEAGLIESRTDDRRRKYFSISRHVSLEVTVSPYEFGTRSAYPSNSRVDVTSCRQVSIELDSLVSRTETTGDQTDTDEETAGCDRAAPGNGTGAGTRTADGDTTRAPQTTPDDDSAAETERTGASRAVPDDAAAAGPSATGTPGTTPTQSEETAGPDAATVARQLHEYQQLERELSLLHRWAEGRITELRERLADGVEVGDPRLVSELLVTLAEEPHQMERLCRRLGAPPPVVEELLDVLTTEGVVRREGRRWTLVE